jgi:hypothetical protein
MDGTSRVTGDKSRTVLREAQGELPRAYSAAISDGRPYCEQWERSSFFAVASRTGALAGRVNHAEEAIRVIRGNYSL